MHRLPPAQRDRVLLVIDALCDGAVRFDGTMVAGGLSVRPVELLAAVAASGSADRFPAMTVERMTKAFGQPVSARTYAEAALAMLTHWPRVQIARDEAAAFEALAKADQQAETEARRKADAIKTRKAGQEAKRAAKAVNAPAKAAALGLRFKGFHLVVHST